MTIHELIATINNPELREHITAKMHKLVKQKKYSLKSEKYLPECTMLFDSPRRRL